MRALITAAISLAVVITWVTPGYGEQGERMWKDETGIGAGAKTETQVTESKTTKKPVCTYNRLNEEDTAIAERLAQTGWGAPKGKEPGAWYRKVCEGWGGVVIWIPQRSDPEILAEHALSYIPLPAPAIGMNPAADRDQLVNLATWLWIDRGGWGPQSTSASVSGLSVTVNAAPRRVIWDMGNGDRIVCTGPGSAYDSAKRQADQHSDCTYTYRKSSAGQPGQQYLITATVEWHATWSSTSGSSGDLGTVSRASSVAVRVAEAQAINR